MSASAFWCELALVDDVVAEAVSVTIDGGRFTLVEIDSEPPARATRLTGITLPGLANAHSHAFHRALRSRTQVDRGSFWTWRDLMYRAAEGLDPDRYHRLASATFAEMVSSGITSVGEFHYLHHDRDGRPYGDANAMGHALMAAASEAGLRITLLDTVYLHGGMTADGHRPAEGVQRRFDDGDVEAWATRVDAIHVDDGQLVGAAVHSVRAVDPASMQGVADWANSRSAPLHAHVSEQPEENRQSLDAHGCTPVELLHRNGVLGERFTAVHATHLTDRDVQLLAASGSCVCMCPTTERDLGDGVGPTGALAAAGVPMSLGSDSHAVIDLFDEARALEMDERLVTGERGHHTAGALLAAATIAGHRSLGWHDAGMIAVGARADLVTLSLDNVRTAGVPTSSALEAVVFASCASDVRHVVVDGREIVSDGRHRSIDVVAELTASITELMDGTR